MIVADVNALVYAFRPETTFHALARDALTTYRDRGELIVLSDVAASFLRIVTDRRLSAQPDDPTAGFDFIEALTLSGRLLREPRASRWSVFRNVTNRVDARGTLIPDALLAATCHDFGAAILTADRDFLRFPGLQVQLLTSIGVIDHTVV